MAEIEIYPTNTCPTDFAELSQRSLMFKTFAPHVHLDIDDAQFAPILSWPYGDGQMQELETMLSTNDKLPFLESVSYEVHMMVQEPHFMGSHMARLGCERVIGHIEAFNGDFTPNDSFTAWKKAGAREVGLALLLDTPLESIHAYAQTCDAVLLMSIATLGKQGAAFDERIYDRITTLRAKYPDLTIAVDGGVGESNIAQLVRAGANRFGVGSAITKASDPARAYAHLRELASTV